MGTSSVLLNAGFKRVPRLDNADGKSVYLMMAVPRRLQEPVKMASPNNTRQAQKDAADQNFDYVFKLLITGNSSVGKTSFLFRYTNDSFTSAFVSTVGIDFKVKAVYRNEKRFKLQIWGLNSSKPAPRSTST
ncbi:ras-related protein Rab-3C-like isoform X1 [Mauremys mutica]|uniref:ras-related protein Rab-3C-like isoform X1 n=3 Tax=Mauremys mutica TaxID=74926 RepID=UPI001D164336|nr:ras-related protein Rab-3C-like isoform X1 [Mauremys mutica]